MNKGEKTVELPKVYLELEKLFSENGYSLFMVGGTSRDFLLGKEIEDFDFVTDATPEEMKSFLSFKESFSSIGSVHINFLNQKVDITTLRVEGDYDDFRHPKTVTFVKELKLDAKRRDFTINAIYIDKNKKVYDYYHGVDDLKNRLISMIGKPEVRLKEDPLRILRALRFSLVYDFSLTPKLYKEINSNKHLLRNITYSKSLIEIEKMKAFSLEKALWILRMHRIDEELLIDEKLNSFEVIDMHCDTITRESFSSQGLFKNDLHLDLNKMNKGNYLLQTFAVFLPLNKVENPYLKAREYINTFKKEIEKNKHLISQVTTYQEVLNNKAQKKMSALLSIEEGGIIEGSLEKLEELYNQGVRMMTLTWNFQNEIGYPNVKIINNKLSKKPNTEDGLTSFGIEVVKKMNELGMIIDCSHLSDKGFFDCIKHSTQPIVCSHSNSREVCNVVRNMTDEMIIALKNNKGVMGINYCPDFISRSKKDQIPDIIKHINHIKEVGGIDVIALGSDFDGIPTPKGMSDASKTILLKEALIKEGYTKEEIDKIFYKNFLRVFKKVCK